MKILIAVENDRFAKAQVDFVVNHKWPEEPTFQIINAIEPILDSNPDGMNDKLIGQVQSWKREQALELITRVAHELRQAFPGADILEAIETDHPSELILDIADQWQPDLIVLGSHGRRASARPFIGSVSAAVLSYAHCQVIVVKPARESSGNESGTTAGSKSSVAR